MTPLRIFFRQHQLVDSSNDNINVVVECGDIATYVPGNTDQTWVEMTAFCEGLEKFQSSWDYINQGGSGKTTDPTKGGSNYDKGITLDLTFWGDAFNYIWNWLLTTECQMLNSIDVRIDDVLCGKSFRLFEIKCDNLEYQPEFACRIDVQLREQDLTWQCVFTTFIWDDWQGWFNQDGTSTKQHPTFLTCVEPRPRLLNSVRMASMFFLYSFPVLAALNAIADIVGFTFIDELIGDIKEDTRKFLELNNFCPAPLIRSYIDNVAGKCGLSVDTIFHRTGTPEYNACLFHPLSGQFYENNGNDEISPSTAFIFENRWDITLAELLDKLKVLYAAEWYVTPNNTIVFKPTIELVDLAPIYDFTTGNLPRRNLHYAFDGTKKPAYGRYQYQPDGSDMGSQEISNLYNDLTDYDGPSNNPMLEGELDKEFEFASTAFIRDGRVKDYTKLLIEDGRAGALVLLLIVFVLVFYAAILAPAMGFAGFPNGGGIVALAAIGVVTIGWAGVISGKAANMKDHFTDNDSAYTGAVRLVTASQTMAPRVLIWDGENLERAKAVRTNNPTPSAYYNPDSVPYTTNNPISTDNPSNNVFNYPMYFDSMYVDNMFDRFHDAIDNPLKSFLTHQSFDFDTDMCCEAMDLLGLWENDFVKIGYVLIIERRPNYIVYGRIENITISYDDWTVKIKGSVIKKK